jgi:hypothetical protein
VQTSTSGNTGSRLASALRVVVELAIAVVGIVFAGWAIVADQQWFDRHFLPAFFVSRYWYVVLESIGRIGAAAIGIALVLVVRRRAGVVAARQPVLVLNVVVAIVLAFAVSEFVLSELHARASEQEPLGQEPRRRLDARLGWTFVPSRAARHLENGREVEYAFDDHGYRVRRLDDAIDFDRPTLVFTGESIIVGEGLTWDESVPAQVGATLGMQSANLAVSAYATDQAYMRLQAELPRFHRPAAVVIVFSPNLFDRNMDSDRPHLGPGLVWQPPVKRWRLLEVIRLLVRYRKPETIDRGIAITREILHATIELARSRGATPLVVVPQFVPELPEEERLRHRVLDDSGLPVVRVELNASWRIPGDRHPDARAAHAIAEAIAARLRP